MSSWLERFLRWFAGIPQTTNPPMPPVVIDIPPINYELPSPKIRLDGEIKVSVNEDGEITLKAKRFKKGTVIGDVTDTGSMERNIDIGVAIILEPLLPDDTSDLIVGDVIVYQTPFDVGNQLIMHRIIRIEQDDIGWWCYTRGDNPLILNADPWVIRPDWLRWLYRGELH